MLFPAKPYIPSSIANFFSGRGHEPYFLSDVTTWRTAPGERAFLEPTQCNNVTPRAASAGGGDPAFQGSRTFWAKCRRLMFDLTLTSIAQSPSSLPPRACLTAPFSPGGGRAARDGTAQHRATWDHKESPAPKRDRASLHRDNATQTTEPTTVTTLSTPGFHGARVSVEISGIAAMHRMKLLPSLLRALLRGE